MALRRDVRVELLGARAEALVVGLRIEGHRAVGHEQRTGLDEIAADAVGDVLPREDPDPIAVAHHARAALRIRRRRRLMDDRTALYPDLAERSVRIADEEPADNR